MSLTPEPLNLKRVKVYPLAGRRSLSSLDQILVDPARPAPPCPSAVAPALETCARNIAEARKRNACVILMYGAHLVKNGAHRHRQSS